MIRTKIFDCKQKKDFQYLTFNVDLSMHLVASSRSHKYGINEFLDLESDTRSTEIIIICLLSYDDGQTFYIT